MLVWMYVCVNMYECLYIHANIEMTYCVHIYIHVMNMCKYLSVSARVGIHVLEYVPMWLCEWVHIWVHVTEHVFMWVCLWATMYVHTSIYEVHTISFQTFFVWALLLIVPTWNSSPLRSNLLQLQYTCCTVPTTSGRPHGSPLVWACKWPSSQLLSSPQLSHNDSLWA